MYNISELMSFYQHEKHFPESLLILSNEALAGKYLIENKRSILSALTAITIDIENLEKRILKNKLNTLERKKNYFDDIKIKLASTYKILSYVPM